MADKALEFTPAGIPATLRSFFQDCELESIDPEVNAFTVIERTLGWGSRAELRWLFSRYPRSQLAEFVRQAGWWRLPRARFLFWLNFFQLSDFRKPGYQRIWPH